MSRARPKRQTATARAKSVARIFAKGENTAVRVYRPYFEPDRGRYRVLVSDGTKRRSMFCATKAEADALVAKLEVELRARQVLTLEQCLGEFIDAKRKLGLRPASLRCIRDRLASFLPLDVAPGSIRETDANRLYERLTKRIVKGGPIAVATHQAILRNTKELFRWLVETDRLTASPWTKVKPIGRPEVGKQQFRPGEAERLDAALMAAAQAGNEGALALLLQLYTGMRSSEVLALTVGDVDVARGYGGQAHTVVYVVRGKTRNARRSIRVYEAVAQLLHKHCAGRPAQQRVFAAERPKQPAPDWLYKRLHIFTRQLGLPDLCPHSLRGLNATLALEGGATSDHVAQSLGHASFAITAKHYADPSAVLNNKLARGLRGTTAHDLLEAILALPEEERKKLKFLLG